MKCEPSVGERAGAASLSLATWQRVRAASWEDVRKRRKTCFGLGPGGGDLVRGFSLLFSLDKSLLFFSFENQVFPVAET